MVRTFTLNFGLIPTLLCGLLGLSVIGIAAFLHFGTYWPAPIETVPVTQPAPPATSAEPSTPHAAQTTPAQKPATLKIMSWNVQFFAGKNKTFFWDVPKASDGITGPDSQTDPLEVTQTFADVVQVIKAQNPDVIFLQEVDDGAKRTGYEDQAERLRQAIRAANVAPYPYRTSAIYWKSAFVPHPKILGSVGMKLVTLSRFPLSAQATRHQLPIMPHSFLEQRFQLKRALLETTVNAGPFKGTKLINAHFDAFAQGFTTMQEQVNYTRKILNALKDAETPFVIGGDFNLLTPQNRDKLHPAHQTLYATHSELAPLLQAFASFPNETQTQGPNRAQYFTYHPSDPRLRGPTSPSGGEGSPDRTIDYFFYSPLLKAIQGQVLNKPEHHFSDHYPVVLELQKVL